MLKLEVLEQLNKSSKAKAMLMLANETNGKTVHYSTVQRWIEMNDSKLTEAKNLAIIAEVLELKKSELLITK